MIESIELKIRDEPFKCKVWFDFIEGYPAKLTGHPDDQYEGIADEYEINHLTIYDGMAWYSADYLINALTDDIEKELEKML